MKKDRISKMANYITINKKASVEDLAEVFNVSEVTVRRDLKKLESQNIITKFYGGVKSKTDSLLSFEQRKRIFSEEKRIIAKNASKKIKQGDCIFIDSGSTNSFILDYIDDRINFTLLTNSLPVIEKTKNKPNIEVYVIGDYIDRPSQSLIYKSSNNSLDHINITKAFMGASGVTIKNGLTNKNAVEVYIKNSICKNAHEIYLLANNTKFDQALLMTFCELEDIDIIFTDKSLNQSYQEFCLKNDIKIII